PTGKRMHKPLVVTRDAASGLPTGKRMHKPLVVTTESKSSAKVKFNDLHFNATINKASPVLFRTQPTDPCKTGGPAGQPGDPCRRSPALTGPGLLETNGGFGANGPAAVGTPIGGPAISSPATGGAASGGATTGQTSSGPSLR